MLLEPFIKALSGSQTNMFEEHFLHISCSDDSNRLANINPKILKDLGTWGLSEALLSDEARLLKLKTIVI